MKVLPELLKSVEFGGGGPKVFGVVMKISARLSEDEYESKITPVIIRLFSSPDRAIRVCLLENLPLMIDHLPQKLVNDKIFPQMVCDLRHKSKMSINSKGHRIYRFSTLNSRTNCEGGSHSRPKVIRSYHKWRASPISCQNSE